MDVVLRDDGIRTGGEVVDRAAVVEQLLDVVDVVVRDACTPMQRGRVIGEVLRIVVIAAPRIPVHGIAANIVDSPAPTDVDGVVGRVGDLVVKYQHTIDVGTEDGAVVVVDLAYGLDAIVDDRHVAIRQARIRRVMRVAADATGEDRAAR